MGALLVQVVDEEDRPVAGAAIQVESDIGPFPHGMDIADDRGIRRDARADEEGSARFEDLPAGGYRVVASTEDGRRHEASAAVAGAGEERIRVALPKTPRLRTFVVLVLDRDNLPVPGARVEVVGGQGGQGVAGWTLPALRGVTGPDGKVSFPDADLVGAVAKAVAPAGREGWAGAWLADTEQRVLARGGLRIVVDATGRLQGRILGVTPPRPAAVHVRAAALIESTPYSCT
ncbi:MAG: carboxypeptidase-like regulatory domain-containing protein, partial [Planctomycetota bacterium]